MNTANQPTSPFMFSLNLGLRYGGLGIVCALIMFFTKKLETGDSGYLLLLFIVLGILCTRAIRKYRDNELQGKISFGRAFGICLRSYVFAGIIYAVFIVLLICYIHPETFTAILKSQQGDITLEGVSRDEVNRLSTLRAILSSPWTQLLKHFLNFSLTGLITAFIVAPICKKEDEVLSNEISG